VYRFVPDDPSEPFVGTLQALRVVGRDRFATTDMDIGDSVDVQWVEIRDPEPAGDTVRGEGQDRGAALFVNGEGMWFHEGEVWICSTNGGPKGSGQIFRLADGRESGTLTLVTQSTDRDELHCPDQITVAPWGQVFMAEDGRGNNFVRLVGQDGTVAPFARNAGSESEIAGVCFSPDGSIMFLNLHTDGLTLAITGRFPTVG
jgi:secreted PhoX family phosphatase